MTSKQVKKREGSSRKVALKDLLPNPYRDTKTFTLDRARIEQLKTSIEDTGFWSGIEGRDSIEHPGKVEIAFGHHRVAAAIELLGPDYEADVYVDNGFGLLDMFQMMAEENADQFGANPSHAMEMVQQAQKILSDMFARVPTLAIESRAKHSTQRAEKNAKAKAACDWLAARVASDHKRLLGLYSNEGGYQSARKAGTPGPRVIVKFLENAINRVEVETYLKLGTDWIEAAPEVIDAAGSHEQARGIATTMGAIKKAFVEQGAEIDGETAKTIVRTAVQRSGGKSGGAKTSDVQNAIVTVAYEEAAKIKNKAVREKVVEAVGAGAMKVALDRLTRDGRSVVPSHWYEFLSCAGDASIESVVKLEAFRSIYRPLVDVVRVVEGVCETMGANAFRDDEREALMKSIRKIVECLSQDAATATDRPKLVAITSGRSAA